MAPHTHNCQAMHRAAARHVAAILGTDACSQSAYIAPLIVCVTLLISFTVRFIRLRRANSQSDEGKPRRLPSWSFETAVMLLFCAPKAGSIYSSLTSLTQEKTSDMWSNMHLDNAGAYWFIGYIAALEALDYVAMQRARRMYRRSLMAQESKAVRCVDVKTPLLDMEEEDPAMNEKMTIYEAARLPPPAPRSTRSCTCSSPTEITVEDTAERRTFRQRLMYVLATPTRKYTATGRATTATSITASYNLSIFLRSLMLYTTLSVAALSLCDEIPFSYLDMDQCGLLKWLAIAGIYGFRLLQLSVGKARFVVRENARQMMMEGGVRLV